MLVAGDAPTVPASLRVRVSLGFAAQGAATATTATAATAAAAAAAASQWEGARVIVRLVSPAACDGVDHASTFGPHFAP